MIGSSETNVYTIRRFAYDNLANRHNQFARGNAQSTNAATHNSELSNLTIQQQQSIDNATSREFDNITSNSTTQRQSTNDATHREFDNFTTSNSSIKQQQSIDDATNKELNTFAISNSAIKQQQPIDNATRKVFDTFPTSNSSITQRQSIDDDILTQFENVRMSFASEVHESHNLKETNSSSKAITKTLVSYNDAKETLLAESTHDNTEAPVVPIKRKDILNGIIKPPEILNDLDDFIKNWNIWKEQLMSFLTFMDEKQLNYNQWGKFFLNFLGPFGQEILNELFFSKEEDKKNYEMLLQKYNAFYKFHTTLKSKSEDTVEYIEKLVGEVAQNLKNVDITIKNKIAHEIERNCKERFIALATSKLPKFKFEITFRSLTLAEIGFLWKNCEEYNFYSNRNCMYCGNFHQEGKCPDLDNECSKCKRRGHVARHCPGLIYITNCSLCGENHKYKCCPSYGETCSKCGHFDHFSWKCPTVTMVKNCRYCGLSHLMGRNACPAKNNFCSICEECGHYNNKCTKIQDVVGEFEID